MSTQNSNRSGFTLIEVLVTLVLVGLLVAFVFPVVSQQVDQADAPRAANDLANIRTAIEMFHVNVRPTYPGDLEDLVHQISPVSDGGSDTPIDGAYNTGQANRWNGPYIDASVTRDGTDDIISGFDGSLKNTLVLFDSQAADAATGAAATASAADFIAVQLDGLTESDFEELNDLLDGEGETDGAAGSQISGRLWYDATATPDATYFLAVPFKQ